MAREYPQLRGSADDAGRRRRKFNAAILLDRQGKWRDLPQGTYRGDDRIGLAGGWHDAGKKRSGVRVRLWQAGHPDLLRYGIRLWVARTGAPGRRPGGVPSASPQTDAARGRAGTLLYRLQPAAQQRVSVRTDGKITAQIRPPESVLVQEIDLSYAILPWSEALQNGAALKAKYGDKVGFRYYEDEDHGIFWSNDRRSALAMVRESDSRSGPELERIRKLYRAAGVPEYQ